MKIMAKTSWRISSITEKIAERVTNRSNKFYSPKI